VACAAIPCVRRAGAAAPASSSATRSPAKLPASMTRRPAGSSSRRAAHARSWPRYTNTARSWLATSRLSGGGGSVLLLVPPPPPEGNGQSAAGWPSSRRCTSSCPAALTMNRDCSPRTKISGGEAARVWSEVIASGREGVRTRAGGGVSYDLRVDLGWLRALACACPLHCQ
jgi:hypothetical protein